MLLLIAATLLFLNYCFAGCCPCLSFSLRCCARSSAFFLSYRFHEIVKFLLQETFVIFIGALCVDVNVEAL